MNREWRTAFGDLGRIAWDLNPVAVWRRRRAQKSCLHHSPAYGDRPAESFVQSALIDTGMRKMFWCTVCWRHWFT